MDVVTREFANENTRIYYDENHKWYYWHGLQADEVIVFMQADSTAENRAGMSGLGILLQAILIADRLNRSSTHSLSRPPFPRSQTIAREH